MKTERKGAAVVCRNCENAIWGVTEHEEGSIDVKFECICSKCGLQPDKRGREKLFPYATDNVRYSTRRIGKDPDDVLTFVTTHVICERCQNENRNVSYRNLRKGRKEINFSGEYNDGSGSTLSSARSILCPKCIETPDLKK